MSDEFIPRVRAEKWVRTESCLKWKKKWSDEDKIMARELIDAFMSGRIDGYLSGLKEGRTEGQEDCPVCWSEDPTKKRLNKGGD